MRVGVNLGPFWLSSGGRRYRKGGLVRTLLWTGAVFLLGGIVLMAAACWLTVQIYVAIAWGIWSGVCRVRKESAPKFWAVPPLTVQ